MKTKDAIKHFGTKAKIARALGLSRQAVSLWGALIPYRSAIRLNALSGGRLHLTKAERDRAKAERQKQRVQSNKRMRMLAARSYESHRAVVVAVANGDLPDPHFLMCSDCDKTAECYDHRDYSRPLDVWPVCHSCDAKRGAGEPYDGEEIFWNERMLLTKKRIVEMIARERAALREATAEANPGITRQRAQQLAAKVK